ncbi:endolytic transglycosylase MltG [Alicyclobacillaceae bacterium I2511]|nr:endolytic transglycosylase MltG [Alicyclobacillaceae bacterium I2511]
MNRRRRAVGLAATVVLILLMLSGWGYTASRPLPAGPKKMLVVHSGETVDEVAAAVANLGLVRSGFLFRWYVTLHGDASSLQAGTYQFAPGLNISQMVAAMVHGEVYLPVVKVTIPEGFTVVQIANRLATAGVCSQQSFLRAEQQDKFTEPFLQQIPNNKEIRYRLEGYLFPDTYMFEKQEPARQVLNTMLQDFALHINSTVMAEIQKSGQTLPQVITIASMVEREAEVPSERPIIASVIDNRLRLKMHLRIDSTIEYIVGYTSIVTYKDLKVPSPYNTYLHRGLPPGPISNPGMASIDAAIHPAHTNFLYYVARYDGTGRHYFATTFAQQLKNEALSQQNYKRMLGTPSK